jgi:hypothetical protein
MVITEFPIVLARHHYRLFSKKSESSQKTNHYFIFWNYTASFARNPSTIKSTKLRTRADLCRPSR